MTEEPRPKRIRTLCFSGECSNRVSSWHPEHDGYYCTECGALTVVFNDGEPTIFTGADWSGWTIEEVK